MKSNFSENLMDIPLVEFMYLVKLYLLTYQVRVAVGDLGLWCCVMRCLFIANKLTFLWILVIFNVS